MSAPRQLPASGIQVPASGIQANLHNATGCAVSARLIHQSSPRPVAIVDLEIPCNDRLLGVSAVSHLFTLFVGAEQHLAVLRQIRDTADAALRAMEERHQAALEVQP